MIAKIEEQIPVIEEEQDFSAMKRAEQYITQLEAEKTIFTDDERNLIVNYAYKMDSFEDARDLADRLAFLLDNSPNMVAQTVINAREEIEQLPDSMIGLTEMHEYGYSWDEMLPLTKERATELFQNDVEIYQLHVDGAETLIEDIEDIENHGGIFGVDKSQWGLYQEREAHAQNYFEEKNIDPVDRFLIGEQDQYGIFQLKHKEENRDIRFMSHDFLQQNGIEIDREKYDLVYTAPLTEDVTLEGLYGKFNIDRPEDFTGHSLSMSDVIVLHQNGENTSHYVDSFGFTEVPEFHRYPTIEEQIAEEETVDLFPDDKKEQVNEQTDVLSQKETPLQNENQHNISYYVIEDLATWANNSKDRSALERFDNIDDAMKQFQAYRGQEWEYSDDSARTTLGISVDGIEFDVIHNKDDVEEMMQQETDVNEQSQEDTQLNEEATNPEEQDSIENINKYMIAEQSFDVFLEDWGEVKFVSRKPSPNELQNWKVATFYLIKDNQILYKFPYRFENNNSEGYIGLFDSVGAVAFRDINNDKKDDIIIITYYTSGAGPTGMVPRPGVTIYLAGDNEFVLADDLITEVENEIIEKDRTIENICDFLLL